MSETLAETENDPIRVEINRLIKKYEKSQMFGCISDEDRTHILDWLSKADPGEYSNKLNQIELDLKKAFPSCFPFK